MALTRNVGCCVSIRDCIGDQESEVDIAAMVVCKNDGCAKDEGKPSE